MENCIPSSALEDNQSRKRDEVARDDICASTSSAPPGPAPAQTKKKTPQKKLASKKKKKHGVPVVRSLSPVAVAPPPSNPADDGHRLRQEARTVLRKRINLN
ncbi:hypothetical protein GUJ93_ZPchr0005g15385 [Zizania palustris]|uniref:Uncharacterized protein n=1 Tax=Zizania palustris TaxID=103762 RepID=A0A8J5VE52_ZIZPA|nr:hypothetical protein GUJ93_ZPchr0005g15385 [Zizania palustris]